MDIPGAFSNLSQSFRDYCYATEQNAMAVVLRMRALRNNPDFFQKICQIAYASLQLIMLNYSGTKYLDRAANVFNLTAGMHDFYRFIQQPRRWFFPVDAASINEFAVLDDLTDFIYQQIGPEEALDLTDDEAAPVEIADKAELRKLLEVCLTAQLDKMADKGDAYRNFGELMKLLEKRLHKFKEDDFNEYAFSTIDLEHLQGVDLTQLNENNDEYDASQWTRHVPLLEKMTHWTWILTDLECVLLCFREWGWLNKEKLSRLEEVLLFSVCMGFSLKFLEASRKQHDDDLSSQGINEAQRDTFSAFAEGLYFITVYLNYIGKIQVDVPYLYLLAIATKVAVAINIATEPRHEYFQEA